MMQSRLQKNVQNMLVKDSKNRKIFLVGFNKCGTTSFHEFFLKNDISSVHWDCGNIAKFFIENKKLNEKPFKNYSNIIAFSDMIFVSEKEIIEPYKHFDYIYKWYPDSYYILNTRHVEDWILSRVNHSDLMERYRKVLNFETYDEVKHYWKMEWFSHHYNILKFFNDKNNFLCYHINDDKPSKLLNFLHSNFPELNYSNFPHMNKT